MAGAIRTPHTQRRTVRLVTALLHQTGEPDGPGLMRLPADAVADVRPLLTHLDAGVIVTDTPRGVTVSLAALAASPGAVGMARTVHRTITSAPTAVAS